MSVKRCCRLCYIECKEYVLLQNDVGDNTEVYEITAKYFDQMLLTEDEKSNVLCHNCWQHIIEFDKFDRGVLLKRNVLEKCNTNTQMKADVKYEVCQENTANDGIIENSNSFDSKKYFDMGYDVQQEDDQLDVVTTIPGREQYNSSKEQAGFKDDFLEIENFKIELPTRFDDIPIKTFNEEELVHNQIESHEEPEVAVKSIKSLDSAVEIEKSSIHKALQKPQETKETIIYTHKSRELDAFIAGWKAELDCDLCSETAKNFDELRSHFIENHKTKFYIKCCERKFFRRSVLVNHIQLHLNPETHKCDLCGKSISTNYNLKLHKKLMHESTKQFKCDICEKLFRTKFGLERHLFTHETGSKDFICSECGKGFIVEQLLKLHIRHVHNIDRVCELCGKIIHGSQALKKHLGEHAGIESRKYPCDECGLELKYFKGLKLHKAAHHNDGTTIYVCGVCGKVAASENALRSHKKLMHDTERKHKCTYCEKAFKRPISLREHIATHTGQDLYQCPHCPNTFKFSDRLFKHRKKCHPVEWEEGYKQHPKIDLNKEKKQIVIC